MKIGDTVHLKWESFNKLGKIIDEEEVPQVITQCQKFGKIIVPGHIEYLVRFSDKEIWCHEDELKFYMPKTIKQKK